MTNLFNMKYLRECTDLTRAELAYKYNIPIKTLTAWEDGSEEAPDYLYLMLLSALEYDAHIKYSPIATTSPMEFPEDSAPIIQPEEWQATHPHFTCKMKNLDCGCHAKLLQVSPNRKSIS